MYVPCKFRYIVGDISKGNQMGASLPIYKAIV